MRLATLSLALATTLAVAAPPSMAATSRAQDPADGSARLEALPASHMTARSNAEPAAKEAGRHSAPDQSGSAMPPMPEIGTLAILIAGLGMIGFAVSRPTTQA